MTVQRLMLILAVVAFILLAVIGAGWFNDQAPDPETLWGLLGLGLALSAGSRL